MPSPFRRAHHCRPLLHFACVWPDQPAHPWISVFISICTSCLLSLRFAAWTILRLFLLQITFFSAWLVLDEQRQAANKIDCCPCCMPVCTCSSCAVTQPNDKDKSGEEGALMPPGTFSKFMTEKYCPFLLKPSSKVDWAGRRRPTTDLYPSLPCQSFPTNADSSGIVFCHTPGGLHLGFDTAAKV